MSYLQLPPAHKDAWTLLHLVHRDISGGNILIYPRIVCTAGRRVLVWVGILADWELAKDKRVLKQRQLDRIVSGL